MESVWGGGGGVSMIKSDDKDIYNVTKDVYFR